MNLEWRWSRSLVVLLALSRILGLPLEALACSVHLEVIPEKVGIGTFFHGQEVTVSATVPQGVEAVVEILGGTVSERLMRKERWGPLWLNRKEVEVKDAPSLYLAASTDPAMLNNASDFRAWGYGAMFERIQFHGQGGDENRAWLLREFISLKEMQGFYNTFPGRVQGSDPEGECPKLRTSFLLGSNVKPGRYEVRLSLTKKGELIGQTRTFVEVRLEGLPALLRSLAHDNPLLYGVLAVVLAMMTGLLIGHVFKGGGGH